MQAQDSISRSFTASDKGRVTLRIWQQLDGRRSARLLKLQRGVLSAVIGVATGHCWCRADVLAKRGTTIELCDELLSIEVPLGTGRPKIGDEIRLYQPQLDSFR